MHNHPAVVVLADISGYTGHSAWSRLNRAHAHHTVVALLKELIASGGAGLRLVRREGDAVVFSAAAADAELVVSQWLPQMRRALPARRERLNMDHPCRCRACAQRNNLSLRFAVHTVDLTTTGFWGPFDPIGAQMRSMLTAQVPVGDYALLSDAVLPHLGEAAHARLELPTRSTGRSRPAASRYIDLGSDEPPSAAPARSLAGWLWTIAKFELCTTPFLVGVRSACADFANLGAASNSADG